MFNFLVKNMIYGICLTFAFYFIMLGSDLIGLRFASSNSFSLMALIITFLTLNFSVLNVRFR